jgi:hypothetical protein
LESNQAAGSRIAFIGNFAKKSFCHNCIFSNRQRRTMLVIPLRASLAIASPGFIAFVWH